MDKIPPLAFVSLTPSMFFADLTHADLSSAVQFGKTLQRKYSSLRKTLPLISDAAYPVVIKCKEQFLSIKTQKAQYFY